jgi:hypothetical protein
VRRKELRDNADLMLSSISAELGFQADEFDWKREQASRRYTPYHWRGRESRSPAPPAGRKPRD